MKYLLLIAIGCSYVIAIAQSDFSSGIIEERFIFEEAPYPSCHSATIAETPTGLVAAWFGGTRERHPDVGIWVARYENGQWTEGTEVANGVENDTLRYPTWNPVLFQIPDGELLLFYKVGPSPSSWWGMLKRSDDGGQTWGAAEKLPEGFLGPVKNKPVLLPNGNLLCASSTEGDGWRVHFEITSDGGKSWRKVGPINNPKVYNIIQPSVLQHADGRLQILCRSKNSVLATAWSEDQGETWSLVQESGLPNNNAGTDAVTLADGRQLVAYNHVKTPIGASKGHRTPLNIAVSEDGRNWEAALVVEDSEISQYSYPSIIQTDDGLVHLVYTWRRERIKHVVIDPDRLETVPIVNERWPAASGPRYKIGVCDWMILKRQKLGAFDRTKAIGADGLELDMGGLGDRPTFDNKLLDPVERQAFVAAAKRNDLEIASIAMSGFYAQNFAEREGIERIMDDCINTMNLLGVKVAFLPLGVQNDLVQYPEKRAAVVQRLQLFGQKAEAAGVIIGIETALSATEEVALLEEIGSDAIQIYFNFQNPLEAGRDLYEELQILGKDRICQIHCTDSDGVLLENNTRLDLERVKQVLDEMQWDGWLIIERSRDKDNVRDVVGNFGANNRYLKSIFQE